MANGKVDELKGRVKEAAGVLTGDQAPKRGGQADQAVLLAGYWARVEHGYRPKRGPKAESGDGPVRWGRCRGDPNTAAPGPDGVSRAEPRSSASD